MRELLISDVVRLSGLELPLIAAAADLLSKHFERPTVMLVPQSFFYGAVSDCKTACGDERTLPFPAWDILPYSHKYPSAEIVAMRIASLWQFSRLSNPVIIATPQALMWRTIPQESLDKHHHIIERGSEISPEVLSTKLVQAGYRREQIVEFLRTFARRGEIVDFFSPAHPDPVRIEFFGNTVDQMRFFSTKDQRSISKTSTARVLPAVEWLTLEEPSEGELFQLLRDDALDMLPSHELEELMARIAFNRHFPGEIWFAPLFHPTPVLPMEFFSQKYPIVVALEPETIIDETVSFLARAEDLYGRVSWEKFSPLPPEFIFPEVESFRALFERNQMDNFGIFKLVCVREIPTDKDVIDFGTKRIVPSTSPTELLKQMELLATSGEVYVAASSERQREKLAKKLGGTIPVPVRNGAVSKSFHSAQAHKTVLSGDEILGFSRTMFTPAFYHQGRAMLSHYGLEQGDYIVHSDYGIAKFLGIKQLDIEGRKTEMLQLQFAGDDMLYVPMEDFYLVSPYLGSRSCVRLSKLGGRKWASAKRRARAKIFELAGELVRIYAMRQIKTRPPMRYADDWEKEVERTFMFEETPDQRSAIEDVLGDLASDHPMDRLLCGDVGFGKTEVAVRASLRAIAQGYQVAILVPTTILAQQHYDTFSERLSELPVRVEMMCRFTPPARAKKIAQGIADGTVDIAIGTHMLLSERIRFKRLGLLIIDEEQWFGVKHKEKLKSLRAQVDVLTMTATPIPRTLYFSVAGLRDLSIIDTPPASRKSVFTQIISWDVELFKKAIYDELERGGQVFFVHNRVQTIGGIEAVLKEAMPDVSIAVAHGQMPERRLERTIIDFRNKKYDVLLSTAIIESGMDMPNVNTIIINRADMFGLSQLYQLRGRVGRAGVQAYAYLVIPPYRSTTPTARKRLRAIMEHTELGSGYHLAMRDMEIRGAGNLLGKEQSGFIEEIGLDLYTKMLAEAVAELRGQKPPIFEPIPFSIDFDAFLPKDYIPDAESRIWAYQRLFTAQSEEKISRIADELSDRFGRLPNEARHLVAILKARILATKTGFQSMTLNKSWISLAFSYEQLPLSVLDVCLKNFSPPPELILEPSPKLRIPRMDNLDDDLNRLLTLLRKIAKRNK